MAEYCFVEVEAKHVQFVLGAPLSWIHMPNSERMDASGVADHQSEMKLKQEKVCDA